MAARPKRNIPQLSAVVHLLRQVTVRQPSLGQIFLGSFPRHRIVMRKIRRNRNDGSLWDGDLGSGYGGNVGAQGLGLPGPADVAVTGVVAAGLLDEGV